MHAILNSELCSGVSHEDSDDVDDDDNVDRSEIRALYPNKFIQYDDQRIYILNTLFNLPGC